MPRGKKARAAYQHRKRAWRSKIIEAGTAPPKSRICREILFNEAGDRRCHWCGRFISVIKSTLEHIIPLGKGGTHTWDNLTLVCRGCNR